MAWLGCNEVLHRLTRADHWDKLYQWEVGWAIGSSGSGQSYRTTLIHVSTQSLDVYS